MRNIMIIEDSDIDALILERQLDLLNIDVNLIIFNSVPFALNYLQNLESKKLPDIIVLDIHMPVMNGFEFLEEIEIKRSDILDLTDIYILSASDIFEIPANITKYNYIKKYFTKPIMMEDLRSLF